MNQWKNKVSKQLITQLSLVGSFPHNWGVHMKEVSILDLRFRFYFNKYPCSQFPRFAIDHPGHDIRILNFQLNLLLDSIG